MPVHDWTRVTPNIFHDFHTSWLAEIRKALNQDVLPENYIAALEQSAGNAVPDVLTLHVDSGEETFERGNGLGGAVAVAEHPPQVDIFTDIELFTLRQKRISIQHVSGKVVALIELVSPGNKRSRGNLDQFLHKITSAIKQGVHVLVLDILPPRKHDPNGIHGAICDEIGGDDFELPPNRPLILASYEAGATVRAYAQPLAVGDPLPPMPLFLQPGWYVSVPLEATYLAAWDASPKPWRRKLVSTETP